MDLNARGITTCLGFAVTHTLRNFPWPLTRPKGFRSLSNQLDGVPHLESIDAVIRRLREINVDYHDVGVFEFMFLNGWECSISIFSFIESLITEHTTSSGIFCWWVVAGTHVFGIIPALEYQDPEDEDFSINTPALLITSGDGEKYPLLVNRATVNHCLGGNKVKQFIQVSHTYVTKQTDNGESFRKRCAHLHFTKF